MSGIQNFHELAKDAGNRLRSFILTVPSEATGVFSLSLTKSETSPLNCSEKWLLSIALINFALTVVLCLYELRIDTQCFFMLAKELEKPEEQRSWTQNDSFKRERYWLIHSSYVTMGLAIIRAYTLLRKGQ